MFNNLRLLFQRFSYLTLSDQTRSLGKLSRVVYPWMNRRKPYWVDQYADPSLDEAITNENKSLLHNFRVQNYKSTVESPLIIKQNARNQWNLSSQRCGLVAIKIGMYPMWTKKGEKMDCTILQIPDNHVLSYVPPDLVLDQFPGLSEPRGYWLNPRRGPSWLQQRRWGVQLVGAVSADPIEFTPAWCGLFTRVGVPPKRKIARFLVSPDAAVLPGTPLTVRHFRVGDYIDITARTINRGFQGVIERWQMKGGPAASGSTKFHRKMGSVAGGGRKIVRGKRMPGVMGNRYRTQRGVQIMRMNPRLNLLYVAGPTPGPVHSYCQLHDTWLHHRRLAMLDSNHQAGPPAMPTWFPEDSFTGNVVNVDVDDDEEDFSEEIYHESVLPYDAPLIKYD